MLTMDAGKVLTDLIRSFPPKGPLVTRLTENELKLKAAITNNTGKVKVKVIVILGGFSVSKYRQRCCFLLKLHGF